MLIWRSILSEIMPTEVASIKNRAKYLHDFSNVSMRSKDNQCYYILNTM